MEAAAARAERRHASPAAVRGNLYRPLEWALIRAPLLPVEAYLALRPATGTPGNRQPGADHQRTLQHLLSTDAKIGAAVAVGSPSLFDALERSGLTGADAARRSAKLLRYLIRMSSRPTPYGLFAGVGIARWAAATSLSLAAERPRTRTRPDMAWLLRLVFRLESEPAVRAQLCYQANPRVLARAGRVYLPAPAPSTDGSGSGAAVSVRETPVVTAALELARISIEHERLVAALAARPGATREKAERLIEELWRQTLLLTDLRPPLTGVNPAEYVARRLEEVPAAAEAREQLAAALAAMATWDELPWERAAAGYRALAQLAEPGEGRSPAGPQVDMALPLDGCEISRAVADEAARAAELLLRLTPLPDGLPYLAAYRGAFEARYGHEREVPLLELMDPGFGLGPPPMHAHSASGPDPRQAGQRNQALHDLAVRALRDRNLVVDLDDDTLSQLETCSPGPGSVPSSLDLSLFVAAESAAELDAGRFQVVIGPNLGATAAGRNLGRFADLIGEQALAGLAEIDSAERAHRPDARWAELIYLPGNFRSANVAIRPHPRRYEIAIGTTPGVEPGRVIPLSELVVGIRAGRFYVRWPRHDADVFGCAGHMLNNMAAPDVCRFLDDVHRDRLAQLSGFDWGPASALPVLPRLQSGRIVLSLARWQLGRRAARELADGGRREFPGRLAAWRQRWQVPRYAYLRFADNRLLLDLEDPAQADELRAELTKAEEAGQVVIEEALPGPDGGWMPGPAGRHITEIVVPLVLRPPEATVSSPRPVPGRLATTRDRIRAPGSDWLFAKLYCPHALHDDLLTGPVAELCEQALAAGTADDWFFLRYADPDPHLRLRFHGHPDRLTGKLVPEICAWSEPLISRRLCSRLCLDTYDREVERYGGPAAMPLAESVFGADSRFTVGALRLSRTGVLGVDMTTLCVLSIDRLLGSLGASPAERLAWYRARVPARTAGGQDYRQRQAALRALLGDPGHLLRQPGGDALARALATRDQEISGPARQLTKLAGTGKLTQPAMTLYGSYVHMHYNRLLGPGGPSEDQIISLLQRTRYGLSQAPIAPAPDG